MNTGLTDADLPQPPPDPGAVTAVDLAAAQGFGPAPQTLAPKTEPPKPVAGPKLPDEKLAESIREANNPAESIEQATARMEAERGARVSINTPTRRLEVPELPGYHLHWFLERNIGKALKAWYEFVLPREMKTVDRSIGGRTAGTTSEDLGGDRIAQIGGINEMGQPEQLVLMKCRMEWYFNDQRKIAERNLSLIKQIFHKKAPIMAPAENPSDYDMRYTNQSTIDMSNGRFRRQG